MMPQATIRLAQPDDCVAISRVARETWQATYEDYLLPENIEWFLSRAYTLDILAQRLLQQDMAIWVATIDSEIIGYAMAGLQHRPEFYAGYVLPAYQRRGIGQRLLRTAAAWLHEHGAAQMWIGVLEQNTAARRFYEAQGARPVTDTHIRIGSQSLREWWYILELIA